jgi:hypothetical protein
MESQQLALLLPRQCYRRHSSSSSLPYSHPPPDRPRYRPENLACRKRRRHLHRVLPVTNPVLARLPRRHRVRRAAL